MGKAARRKRQRYERATARFRTRREQRGVRIGPNGVEVARDVQIVVGVEDKGGERDDRAIGAMLDPATGRLLGTTPGTPAADLDPGELARMLDTTWDENVMRRAVGDPNAPPDRDKDGRSVHYAQPDPRTGDLHMEPFATPDGFTLPTPVLLNLSSIARQYPWCSKVLSESTLERLDPMGRHLVLGTFKHTTRDWQRDNVRMHMMLKLRDRREPFEVMCDVPTHQFGIYLAAVQARAGRKLDRSLEGTILPEGYAHLVEHQPHWAAGRSFVKVHKEATTRFKAMELLQTSGDHAVDGFIEQGRTREQAEHLLAYTRHARTPMGAAAYNLLSKARLIVAEPEWVQGINDKRPDDAAIWRFAHDAHLPFQTVYLDFEGPGGFVPTVPLDLGLQPMGRGSKQQREVVTIKLAGALVWQDGDALNVMPFAGPDYPPYKPYEPMGRLIVGVEPPPLGGDHEHAIAVDGVSTGLRMSVLPPMTYDGVRREDLPDGRIELPGVGGGGPRGQGWYEPADMGTWACEVLAASLRTLRMLYMLQGSNVELVEAKLHGEGRRRVKRAEKRAWPIEIGLMVAVRWKKRMYLKPPGTEDAEAGKVNFSHAFWVQGHPKFYPLGTRTADALAERDPTKLVEDPTGLNRGLGRIVYCPPFVKGKFDHDTGIEREPVEKARKIVGNPYEDDPPTDVEAA